MPYTEDYVHQLRIQRRIFLLINIIAAFAFALLYHKVTNQGHEIQQQRRDAIVRQCTDQNARHDGTIHTLDDLLKKSGVSEARRKASRATTVLLINAIAPKVKDCQALADKATSN